MSTGPTNSIRTEELKICSTNVYFSTWISEPGKWQEQHGLESFLHLRSGDCTFSLAATAVDLHKLKIKIDEHLSNLCQQSKQMDEIIFNSKQEALPL